MLPARCHFCAACRFYGVEHRVVLRDEIGRDDQVVPGLYSEHGGVFVACKIGHRLHGEVVGHDHAVKAEPVAQQSVYGRESDAG